MNLFKKHILILFLLTVFSVFSQKSTISISSGLWNGVTFADGYFASGSLRLPISNVFEIATSFTFGESTPTDKFNYFLITDLDETIGFDNNSDNKTKFRSESFNSFDFLFLIKPFKFFKNLKTKNELIIGTGYGYKTYSRIRIDYIYENQYPRIKVVSSKKTSDFAPYFLMVNYNYLIKNKFFLGVEASINDYDGMMLLYGLRLGVRF